MTILSIFIELSYHWELHLYTPYLYEKFYGNNSVGRRDLTHFTVRFCQIDSDLYLRTLAQKPGLAE